jgi:hypothetical protein
MACSLISRWHFAFRDHAAQDWWPPFVIDGAVVSQLKRQHREEPLAARLPSNYGAINHHFPWLAPNEIPRQRFPSDVPSGIVYLASDLIHAPLCRPQNHRLLLLT